MMNGNTEISLKMTFHRKTFVSDSEVLGHLSVIDYECSFLSSTVSAMAESG